jgi:hypothetical protein
LPPERNEKYQMTLQSTDGAVVPHNEQRRTGSDQGGITEGNPEDQSIDPRINPEDQS